MTTTGYGSAATPDLVASGPSGPIAPPTPPGARRRRPKSGSIPRWTILVLFAIYFIGPLAAAVSFTLQAPHGGLTFQAYRDIFQPAATGQIDFATALVYSLELSLITILITLALMLPTQLVLHLRFPRVRPLVEIITLLPLVFPPIVLVVGIDNTFSWVSHHKSGGLYDAVTWMRDDSHPLILALLYVMLAMPFVYRSLDAGINAVDVRTMVEASRNLGAGWLNVLWRVLMPSLRTAILNAGFLCFALVMGEYTISSILLYTKPFPVWLYQLPTTSGRVQAAVSVFSLLLVEVLLLLVGALNWRRTAATKG